MSRSTKVYAPEFIEYQQQIIKHSAYQGLEYGGSWVKAGNSADGKKRTEWANKKIEKLGLSGSGIYAKLMYEIHPFKEKPCQTCGKVMSLNYIYPNKNFLKKILTIFPNIEEIEEIETLSIYELVNEIREYYPSGKARLKEILVATLKDPTAVKFCIPCLIEKCIYQSKLRTINAFGPGAMSNFPDRFDGFHSYNRCCRATEDSGRSAENLKSYTKDRRAYEAWSDGNHRAANQLMGESIFLGTGLSADHLGPISLGFVHDPRFMKVMNTGDNSSKRDRLILSDLIAIMTIEKREGIKASSWFCTIIWEAIKDGIQKGTITSDNSLQSYQAIFKKNKDIFFKILNVIADEKQGSKFLTWYLQDKYRFEDNYLYNYSFDIDKDSSTFGQIKSKVSRNLTARSDKEEGRAIRIGLESITDYANKTNRKISEELTEEEILKNIVLKLSQSIGFDEILTELKSLMVIVQQRLLQSSSD